MSIKNQRKQDFYFIIGVGVKAFRSNFEIEAKPGKFRKTHSDYRDTNHGFRFGILFPMRLFFGEKSGRFREKKVHHLFPIKLRLVLLSFPRWADFRLAVHFWRPEKVWHEKSGGKNFC